MLKVHDPCQGPELALVDPTDELPEQADGTSVLKSTSWKPPPLGLTKLTLEPSGTARLAGALPFESPNAEGVAAITVTGCAAADPSTPSGPPPAA